MRDLVRVPEGADNKRRHPRVAIELRASLRDEAATSRASLLNVARGGVFVATARPPEIGRQVQVRFRMLATRVCEASGKVVWRTATDGSGGFGVEFERTNHDMDCFLRSIANLPARLHAIYLADVLDPQITVASG